MGAEERFFREECQSNYRQRCSPAFSGGTKIPFQLALPLCTFLPLLPLIFFYFSSSWPTLCLLPFPICSFQLVHRRGRAPHAHHGQKQNTLSPFGCVMSKCVRSLQPRSPGALQSCSLSGFCRAAAASPHQVSLSVCSA